MEVDSNVGENPLINEGEHVEEPKKGMCFSSREEVYTFYGKYAKHIGFSIAHRAQHFGDNGKLLNFAIECSRAGQRKKTSEVNPSEAMFVHKNWLHNKGGYESLTFDERDARNYIERARRNLFWADARSRATYEAFGDVVSFDTTYLTNKYDMPFALFVGVNHHGQSILLGCGLLSSEDTNTFVWLFKSWLSCMSNHPPKAIITDQCIAMQNAIEIVFPQDRHRWFLWHIMKKIPEKLKGYARYEAIKLAMQNAVYDCLTRAEFESKWEEMLATFNLYDNEWLGVLYNERNRWVPVYVKDIFWAGISTTQRSESMNALFDGYVSPKTTLKQFVEQYDNALRNKVEKEKKADFKSRHKLFDCLTIYEFEKQFQQAYTNAKFKEVQGELKRLVYCQAVIVKEEGSISTYRW
ncbi:protein FAR-RED IMPAIRED RESPONSE 1-like [Camellia sinensis]|uniref:protein FAR-RED IMPAIRED RESPONSE 1-like n=1 Tax=Camellia sinensis TaxID=4442 RepID=UPI001036B8B5|nr:protein FAR-RED IMPAIRED RESPONSE 1-like [Camellia sinensis]